MKKKTEIRYLNEKLKSIICLEDIGIIATENSYRKIMVVVHSRSFDLEGDAPPYKN